VTVLDLSTRSASALTTQRTIARRLVHRAALAEVFLTDFLSVDRNVFLAAAQLPPAHAYYGDHTWRPGLYDPLVVFESVRQMLLCAMHLQHNADASTKSITATASMDIRDIGALRADNRALDLELWGRVALEKEYNGATSRVVHEVDISAGGREVGTITVDTALRPDDVYQKLRMSHRATPPPSSDGLSGHGPAELVPPHLVGRELAANVLLGDVRAGADSVVALLRVPVGHPSMFDHPQDHVPGPVMMEAARQAALVMMVERFGESAVKLFMEHIDAEYLRFAELDSPIVVEATPDPDPHHPGGGRQVAVAFLQDGEAVARMRVRCGSLVGWTPQAAGGGHGH
jgi:2-oxo-3-(phosphooxy)propyl 3-oxoalkanoate synthase